MENVLTYDFSGNAITFIGLIGVMSTAVILVTAFTKYFNSSLRK